MPEPQEAIAHSCRLFLGLVRVWNDGCKASGVLPDDFAHLFAVASDQIRFGRVLKVVSRKLVAEMVVANVVNPLCIAFGYLHRDKMLAVHQHVGSLADSKLC